MQYLPMLTNNLDQSVGQDERIRTLAERCFTLEADLRLSKSQNENLRRRMKDAKSMADDGLWRLQEELCSANSLLRMERESNAELRSILSKTIVNLAAAQTAPMRGDPYSPNHAIGDARRALPRSPGLDSSAFSGYTDLDDDEASEIGASSASFEIGTHTISSVGAESSLNVEGGALSALEVESGRQQRT
jgi:hypothetical protein